MRENGASRRRILHLLKKRGPMSAAEITAHMHISHIAVRRHLSVLEKDGYIDSRMVHQAKGRPAAVYHLTDAADELFPKEYAGLTLELLNELAQEAGPEMVDRLFHRRRDNLLRKYASQMNGKPLPEKVALLARFQNDSGYMAEWTQTGEDEFVLTEHNCPISRIANRYETACRCELELFQTLLEADVHRLSCLARGERNCSYTIRPGSAIRA